MSKALDRRLAQLEKQAAPPVDPDPIIIVAIDMDAPSARRPFRSDLTPRYVDYRKGLEALAPLPEDDHAPQS